MSRKSGVVDLKSRGFCAASCIRHDVLADNEFLEPGWGHDRLNRIVVGMLRRP
jgi:hypothetical protein